MNAIVVSDDSSTARMFIRRCLEIAGLHDVEFLEAANGAEVIEIIKANPAVGAVVTDLNMPVMNGMDLLKRMKSSPKMNAIPVLVVTSVANEEKIKELKEVGAFMVLNKPVSPASILPAVNYLQQNKGEGAWTS